MRQVFKVCAVDKEGACASPVACEPTTYRDAVGTYRAEKALAFDTLVNACRFRDARPRLAVFRAYCEEAAPVSRVAHNWPRFVAAWWRGEDTQTVQAPRGTLRCEGLWLGERVLP